MLPDFRIRQRDILLDIARALTEELDLGTVLRRILRAAADLLAGQAGLIALREEEGRWRIHVASGIPEPLVAYFSPLLADIPEHGDPRRFALPELNRRLQSITQAATLGLLQGVGLPMVARDEVVGLIYIFRTYPTAFTANDRALLSDFAAQAAIAVHNARLYRQATQERRRLDAILESSADGILIMDSAHHIQRFNRALMALTGWSAADAIGREHDDVIRWLRRDSSTDLAQAEAGGWPLATANAPAPLYVEGDLLRRNGSAIPAGITYAPLFDREARLVNLIVNVRDITRFREADKLKSDFISVISHELKTPVAIIKGYAETLNRTDAHWDKAIVQDSLAVIVDEADKLADLIENLLDASRLQAGAFKLTRVEVPLDKLAAQQIARFKTQAAKHSFQLDFPPDFPLVTGDETRLGQVLSNLLSNALKYSPNGGRIIVGGSANATQVTVSVRDEGVGLAPDDLPHIFERFYRVESELSKRVKGTGLGLYLVQAILEAHGGRVWAESSPGQGTTIWFTIPR